MNTTDFLNYLKQQPYYQGQLIHIERIAAKRAKYGKLNEGLAAELVNILKANGTNRLFSHQVQAIEAIRQGAHVVVATGTASGKTLCYNLPVLEAILGNYRARALYLFPTKALAHDQLRSLAGLAGKLTPRPVIGAYDGDTSQKVRGHLRNEGAIILTNPDMLHVGILPHHNLWRSFFKDLKFIVLDEAHIYRGVFGSHVAVILRRLNRLCQYYGSNPQYIACSATIANPGEHITRLTGQTPVVIDQDGAPKSTKLFAFWNPPLMDDGEAIKRRSPYAEAAALFVELARCHIRNITFAKARIVAELILKYARTALRRTDPELLPHVASYRAGYLAGHRREIELALFGGDLIGVTATNALELGVDVGGLDATVSVGYPGSIASLWQQAGRAGRGPDSWGREASLAILIGLDNPLDQYFMRHPEALFDRPHEHALIDPTNVYVLSQHLACAAMELPLTAEDEAWFGTGFVPTMIELEERGQLVYQPEGDSWLNMGRNYPAQRVNIRSMGRQPIVLLDADNNNMRLEIMDASIAPSRVYPGAIYMHRGESYRVKSLDLAAGEARLGPADVDYYTQAREINHVQIVQPLQRQVFRRSVVYWGKVRVTQQVVAYRQIRHFTESRGKEYGLDFPPNAFQTRAVWWDVPRQWQKNVERRGWNFSGGLHAIEQAAMGILPLFAMCHVWDIGGHTTLAHPETGLSQIFIYDAYPGGVGISEQGFGMIMDLWRATLSTILECPCETGCPSCIYSARVADGKQPLDKQAAIWILESLLKR